MMHILPKRECKAVHQHDDKQIRNMRIGPDEVLYLLLRILFV